MKNKIFVLVLMWASLLIFLPAESRAAGDIKNNSLIGNEATTFAQDRRGRGRGRGRGWDDNWRWRSRNRSWNRDRWNRGRYMNSMRNNRRSRWTRQSYWRNGRRYTRTVRVYY